MDPAVCYSGLGTDPDLDFDTLLCQFWGGQNAGFTYTPGKLSSVLAGLWSGVHSPRGSSLQRGPG